MKKVSLLFGIAVLLAACAKAPAVDSPEVDEPVIDVPVTVAKENVTFAAAFAEEPAVKTVLEGNGSVKSVNWVEDEDVISILWDGGSTTSAASSSGATTTFSASVDDAALYYAVYPSSVMSSYSASTLSVTIPSAQHGTFAEANIAVASTTSSSLNFGFKNLCALAKVTLTRSDIAEIRFSGANSEVLAGAVTVSLDGSGIPSCDASGDSETEIVLTPSAGKAFAAGTYYFSLIPQDIAGLSIQLTTETGNTIMTRSTAHTAELERSVILNFGTLDSSGTPTELQLTFDFTGTQLEGWPTAQIKSAAEPRNCIYPLDGTNYNFILADGTGATSQDVFWAGTNATRDHSVLFMSSQYRYFGLPVISGYKLSKVDCTRYAYTTTKNPIIGVVNAIIGLESPYSGSHNDIIIQAKVGGSLVNYQTWSAADGTVYTYDIADNTLINTQYYLYAANPTGFTYLTLTYTK